MLHAFTLMTAWQLMRELELLRETIEVHLAPTTCGALSASQCDLFATAAAEGGSESSARGRRFEDA